MPTLTELPTDHLVPHERNVRSGVGDLSDLMASITAVGILQPLLVVPLPEPPSTTGPDIPDRAGPWYQIIVGHRRHAAATQLQLDTIPCIIATDEGEADRVVKMVAENVHRLGLSASEEAEAYRQLTLLDWTPEQISEVTAKPVERVRDALTLTTLPRQVRVAADDGQLDLADAAQISEFTDDPKAVERILAKGKGWGFTHAVAEERSKRDRRNAVERLKAELVLAGVRLTTCPKDFGYRSRAAEASTLLDGDGTALDPDAVRTLPGFAAFVDATTSPPKAVVYCLDPEAHGYTRTRPTSYVPAAVAEQRARELAARAAQAQALVVAATVRRDFLAATHGTAKGAKGAHLTALRAAMTDPTSITVTEPMQALVTRLAGCDVQAAATAGADRLARVLVARWLTVSETNLDDLAARKLWNASPERALAYLQYLTRAGYVLSAAEQLLYDEATELITQDSDQDDEDDEDEEPACHGEDLDDTDIRPADLGHPADGTDPHTDGTDPDTGDTGPATDAGEGTGLVDDAVTDRLVAAYDQASAP
jgi:ParB/RepB/Spo0J family partition protein